MIKNRSWVYLTILTLVVAATWVVVSAISHSRQTTISKDVETAAAPLDPELDVNFFTQLQSRAADK